MESIWSFQANESVETEKIDLKPFKPLGRFFDDIQTITRLFNIKIHPALRQDSYRSDTDD